MSRDPREAGTRYGVSHPDLFRRACDLLMMEQPRDRVVMLVDRDAPEGVDASALVREAWESTRGDRRGEGRAELRRGILMLAGGLLATLAAFTVLTGLGAPFFLVFTGLIGYGGFLVVSGMKKLSG